MEDELIELEKNKNNLLEEFISKGNLSAFKRLLNIQVVPKPKKEYKVERLSDFYKRMKVEMSKERTLKSVHLYNNRYKDIDKMDFNRYFFPDDPEEKKNKLKGNYLWGSAKFKQIKYNLAKRKGIPYEQFEMPKYDIYKPKHKENKITLSKKSADNLYLPNISSQKVENK